MIWEKIVVLSVRFVKIRITILGADTDRSSQRQMPYSWKHSVHLYRTLGTTASTCIVPLEPVCAPIPYPWNHSVNLHCSFGSSLSTYTVPLEPSVNIHRTLGTTLSTCTLPLELLCQPVPYPWNHSVQVDGR